MPRLRNLIALSGDLAVIVISYLAAFASLRPWPIDLELMFFLEEDNGLSRLVPMTLSLLLGFYYVGLYDNLRVQSRRKLTEDLLLTFGGAFLLQAFLTYSSRPLFMPRFVMLAGSLLALVFILIWRSFFSLLLLKAVGFQKVLFFGNTELTRRVASHIAEHPEKGFEVVGVLKTETSEDSPKDFPFGKVLEPSEQGFDELQKSPPDRICVAGTIHAEHFAANQLMQCSMSGINVESVGDLYELLFQRVALETVTLNQLIFSPTFRPSRWKLVVQDVLGRILSLAGILVTWPLMLMTAIAVRWDSPGPALLKQKRVGLNGEIFEILKFRSMYVDGDTRFGIRRATEQDPRITRVGRVIRVTRLDELPQFFNVLRGEMSFVGPRPEMPVYTEKLSRAIPLYSQRWRVKPGITGWAQLFHVPELTTEDTKRKLEYDLYYIKNMSPILDFLIVFHTVRALLYRTGAR